MPYGFSLEDLTKSLSAIGSTSGEYTSNAITGVAANKTIPLLNYFDFSEHTLFGNAKKKLDRGIFRLLNEYPIGLSGTLYSDTANLSATNILQVDEYKKKSNGFDLWLLKQFGKSSTSLDSAYNSLTAGAVNDDGEIVPLVIIHRNEINELTSNTQQDIREFLEENATRFEEESISLIEVTPGTSYSYFINTDGTIENQNIVFEDLFELPINRAQSINNMLPEILFNGDEEGNLENLIGVLAEEMDLLHSYVDQMQFIKKASYEEYNTTPRKMLPVIAAEFGVELYDSAADKGIQQWLIESTSGATAREVTDEIWNRIVNSIPHLLKEKGTVEAYKDIVRLYGLNEKIIKINEYSIFNKPILVKESEYVDTKALYSDGTNYVQTINGMTNSSRVFDFVSETDFTIEARLSATAVQNHTIIDNDYFSMSITDQGRLNFQHKVDVSVFATTPDSSVSSYVHMKDHFVNVAAKKENDDLTIFLMTLSGNPAGGEDIVFTSSANVNLPQISSLDFDSQGTVATRFPGTDFNGFLQEVRVWTGALHDEDIREHARNFESISYVNSEWADNDSLSAHWKLREDSDLQPPNNKVISANYVSPTIQVTSETYNDITVDASANTIESAVTDFETEGVFLVGDVITISDATDPLNDGVELTISDVTGSVITLSNHALTSQGTLDSTLTLTKTTTTYNDNTAEPIGFAENRYKHFDDVKKIKNWYPVGLSQDKDKVLLEAPTENEIDDSSIVGFSMNAIDPINRDIHNHTAGINLLDLYGGVEEIYNKKYNGAGSELWDSVNSRYRQEKNTQPLADIDSFIKATRKLNDKIGGIFNFIQQFTPAKSRLAARGILIENPILERNKIQRRIGARNQETDEYIGSPKPDSIFLESNPGQRRKTDDFDASPENLNPSVVAKKDNELSITNKYLPGALLFQDSSSGNIVELHPTACTTAHFQGFKYVREKSYEDRSLTTERALINVTKKSTTNGPRISEARVAKLLPVKRLPADSSTTEIDVTLDNLIINPTSPSTANSGFINGKIRLLSKGQAFNSESPTFRFEFPTSADGTNLFVAEMGDVDEGQGRIIEGIDNTFVTSVVKNDVQMRLTLANIVTSLSAVDLPNVTQNQVDDSDQGSLGVVPIRITNLFNNNTQIVRVAINAVESKNPELLTQLASQGGVKLTS